MLAIQLLSHDIWLLNIGAYVFQEIAKTGDRNCIKFFIKSVCVLLALSKGQMGAVHLGRKVATQFNCVVTGSTTGITL